MLDYPQVRFTLMLAFLSALVGTGQPTFASEKAKDQQERFFEMKIRPLLVEHCYKCHGRDKQNGELRLDRFDSLIAGGDSGPAIEPGNADASLLMEAVRWESYEMPPKYQLESHEIDLLARWIDQGAHWPRSKQPLTTDGDEGLFSAEDRNWWPISPFAAARIPGVDAAIGEVLTPVDAFILSRLAEEGLTQAPPAERRILIRRLYFDMLGVPPAPEEIDRFENDPADDAYARLVDAVLDDPRYGQRWARHWLDIVRYAESDGYRQDAYRANAWRYRDYVIRSFNEDKPYRQFVIEQLAGDEVAPEDPDALIATGYLRHGAYEYNLRDAEGQWELIQNELTDNVSDVFFGLSMGCARCHDHKFDPILQRDYFRLQAYLKPIYWDDNTTLASPTDREEHHTRLAAWQAKNRELLDQLEVLEAPARKKLERAAVTKFPDAVQACYDKPPEERTAYENQIADLVWRQVLFEFETLTKGMGAGEKAQWEKLKKELQKVESEKPKPLPMGMIVRDAKGAIPKTTIPDSEDQQEILPGVLTLVDAEPASINRAKSRLETSSARRANLAAWITDEENPLPARVMVNRVWHWHFGRGIVASPSEFGRLGITATHPDLLDWLAKDFIKSGWKLKPLHRTILLSATYRQSSAASQQEVGLSTDPENQLLWRFPPQRLEAEQIRDAMLTVSGELLQKSSGPSAATSEPHRTIFTKVIRNSPDPLLESFDGPSGFSSVSRRNRTTTSTQSLLMLNGAWTLKRADAMAARLLDRFGEDIQAIIRRSFETCYGREPTLSELDAAEGFILRQEQIVKSSQSGTDRLPPETFLDSAEMLRWNTAFNISDAQKLNYLHVPSVQDKLPQGSFTIEAIVYHRTMFPNASVRTIAARWDGSQTTRGWNFGVTSAQSAHRPRNLIIQLVGDSTEDGKLTYEVVASNLRIPSNKPYFVSAAVDFETHEVVFRARDMSYDESETEVAVVSHHIAGHCVDSGVPLTIGARANASSPHNWDGMIDDVRLSDTAIADEDRLTINNMNQLVDESTVGMWRFARANPAGLLADFSSRGNELHPAATSESETRSPIMIAVADFCHALLNSNEFQNID